MWGKLVLRHRAPVIVLELALMKPDTNVAAPRLSIINWRIPEFLIFHTDVASMAEVQTSKKECQQEHWM